MIYKAINNEPMRLYTHSTENSFTDNMDTSPLETKLTYRIQAVYEDGSSSDLSNEVWVKI